MHGLADCSAAQPRESCREDGRVDRQARPPGDYIANADDQVTGTTYGLDIRERAAGEHNAEAIRRPSRGVAEQRQALTLFRQSTGKPYWLQRTTCDPSLPDLPRWSPTSAVGRKGRDQTSGLATAAMAPDMSTWERHSRSLDTFTRWRRKVSGVGGRGKANDPDWQVPFSVVGDCDVVRSIGLNQSMADQLAAGAGKVICQGNSREDWVDLLEQVQQQNASGRLDPVQPATRSSPEDPSARRTS